MHTEDESELIKLVLAGKNGAFKSLIQRYERLVLHIVTPLVGISEDREDLCQDVFIKVYQGLGSFKQNSRLSTWIGNIAYHTCLNFLRKRKVIFLEDIRLTGKEHDDTTQSGWSFNESLLLKETVTPEQEIVKKETSDTFEDAINKLPEMQRLAVILFHYEELSLQEISLMLHIPENTIKSYLFRGRKRLKELIDLEAI